MRQRGFIAMALSCNPSLLIADEPTTALDVTVQAQILELLKKLRRDFGSSIVLITHDLGVVAEIADRVMVMYAGRIVERGTTRDIFTQPWHPYTWGLHDSIPPLDGPRPRRLPSIPGQPALALEPAPGLRLRRRAAASASSNAASSRRWRARAAMRPPAISPWKNARASMPPAACGRPHEPTAPPMIRPPSCRRARC